MMRSDSSADRIEALEARLTELEDDRAVRELLSRYSNYADSRRDDDWIALFVPDGSVEIAMGDSSGAFATPRRWQGPNGLREFITNPEGHQKPGFYGRSLHMHGNNSVIRIDGQEAVATTYSLLLQKVADGTVQILGGGISSWAFAKRGDRWFVVERRRREVGAEDTAAILAATET
jgi:hypothetical protein